MENIKVKPKWFEPAEAAPDEKIRAAGEYIIKKHIGALKELAKGPEG